ncbi:TadE/TadG family type IV pilus assembly protein [Streptantibioticus ferralitis]
MISAGRIAHRARPSRWCRGARRPPGRGAGRRERGSASVEFLGFLPILLLVALAGVQLGLVAYVGTQAGTAARAAARTNDPGAGTASVSGWLRGATRVDVSGGDDAVQATVTIKIPSVFPGVSLFDPVTRSATMPRDGAP